MFVCLFACLFVCLLTVSALVSLLRGSIVLDSTLVCLFCLFVCCDGVVDDLHSNALVVLAFLELASLLHCCLYVLFVWLACLLAPCSLLD